MRSVRVVGLGGSLREMSTSRTALQVALEAAAASGADVELIWVRDLGLPLYTDEHAPPPGAHRLAESVYQADALIWSSPTYHGSVSGSFKNALDWLILLADNEPPYLPNKPIGLVTTAGGVQGLQAVNTMDFIARSLQCTSIRPEVGVALDAVKGGRVPMRRGLVELEPGRGWLQPRPRGRPAPRLPSPRPSAYPGTVNDRSSA